MCILHAKVIRVKGRDHCNLISQVSENKWENTLQNDFPVLPTERHETLGKVMWGAVVALSSEAIGIGDSTRPPIGSLGHLPSVKHEKAALH